MANYNATNTTIVSRRYFNAIHILSVHYKIHYNRVKLIVVNEKCYIHVFIFIYLAHN